ncbi:uncharacterized protein GGS22DRAFT_11679 [Annulohypoxylon maeteangense]|uniref:uncharacterized protein n=1 Tax=Annulohypoxylon maeteangense TaxID=1927788 RepID=UPI002007B1CA|nr:uncharacterized protein GGS22DRAFT_11679 [Annulohypoxylon maeteangense]KAI0890305.1 hypothetical protein GGS22DRAFT_11679 [Annulohypoxylon maeteangense]
MLSFPSISFGLTALAAVVNAAHYDVTVGKGGQLKFDPETLTAQAGDTVTYKFFAKNHAVAQSAFATPCQLQDKGIFSGFTPNSSPDVEAPTTFTITVNDTKPLWFYCPQTNGNHCQNGMVHSINAPASGNTFDAYKANALKAATPSTPPAGTLPVGGLRKLHIDVGFNGNLVFNPNNVTELVGTVFEFSYNPQNHSIVQSSFDKPCQPLTNGFAAPFVPTMQTPSGVTFEVTVEDSNPIWFYCAQTAKTHCQAGMVGSINAATTGDKTFAAFAALAAKAPPSTIPPNTPLLGTLKVNGTIIANVNGNVLNTTTLDPSLVGTVPPPGASYAPYIGGMAGGDQPADYQWAPTISDEAVELLQALEYISNALVSFLFSGYVRLAEGAWTGAYPTSITQTLGSLTAQALIHRKTYSDSLQHYSKPTVPLCQYNVTSSSVDTWLQDVQTILTLSIGAKIDVMSLAATNDSWMIPALATELGAQARMSAVLNMMQSHYASTAPREALMPYQLAYSYIANKYASNCGDGAKSFGKVFPALSVANKTVEPSSGRLLTIKVEIPSGSTGDHWVAWIGPWGGLQYTSVAADGTTTVPSNLSGHVWAVLTTAKDLKAHDIETKAVAGPEMIWTTQQWGS